jgi:hypothetical protein
MSNPLTGGKTALQSITIRALIANMLIKVGAAVGLDLAADDLDQLLLWGVTLAALIPDVIAWYGRVRARTRIVSGGDGPPDATTPIIVLCMIALATAAGCAKTPAARWAQGRGAVTATQEVILQQHGAGVISDADLVAIDPFIQSARGALDRAKAFLPDGGPDFDFYLDLATDVLSRVKAFREKHHESRSDSRGDRLGTDDHPLWRGAGSPAGDGGRNYHRAA